MAIEIVDFPMKRVPEGTRGNSILDLLNRDTLPETGKEQGYVSGSTNF